MEAGKVHNLVLVVDEIDSFSKAQDNQKEFTDFLKLILASDWLHGCGVNVVGIANSVDFFKEEYAANSTDLQAQMICKNELKVIFAPYTRA